MSRDEVRSMNKKKIHRKRKIKRIAVLAVLALAILCAGIALVLTVFFRIDTIQIKGERLYGDKEIIAYSGVEIGDNLFMISEKKINESLSSNMPYIKSITIERKMPDTLIINVVSAKASAAIPYGDGYVIIDADGKILDNNAPKVPENTPSVSGLKVTEPVEGQSVTLSGEGNTEDLLEITKAIRDSGIEKITEINCIKKGYYELKYDGRVTLKLGSMVNAYEKLARAKKTIEEQNINEYFIGTLNLSVEPNVYISSGDKDKEDTTDVTDENGNIILPEGENVSEEDIQSEDEDQ